MGAFSIWHWLIVLVVVLVLFGGKGKISSLMGDFGKGLKSFKKNVKDEGGTVSEDSAKAIETESMRDGATDFVYVCERLNGEILTIPRTGILKRRNA